MDSCIFCKIIKGEIPCTKVYEDEKTIAFLDILPVNKGHCLVLPKEHYETILDVPDDILSYVSKIVKKLSKSVMDGESSAGFCILQNNFKASGQAVPHYHVHIIPRNEGDGYTHWKGKEYPEGEAEKEAEKIMQKID